MLRKICLIALAGAALAAPAYAADPLAYRSGDDAALAKAAAAGHSHVLYERSPDGVFSTAARTARFRPLIDRAQSELPQLSRGRSIPRSPSSRISSR